jgi:hypothetical protein
LCYYVRICVRDVLSVLYTFKQINIKLYCFWNCGFRKWYVCFGVCMVRWLCILYCTCVCLLLAVGKFWITSLCTSFCGLMISNVNLCAKRDFDCVMWLFYIYALWAAFMYNLTIHMWNLLFQIKLNFLSLFLLFYLALELNVIIEWLIDTI